MHSCTKLIALASNAAHQHPQQQTEHLFLQQRFDFIFFVNDNDNNDGALERWFDENAHLAIQVVLRVGQDSDDRRVDPTQRQVRVLFLVFCSSNNQTNKRAM